MSDEPLDLGAGYSLQFTCWEPDRELNPQYEGVPDVERFGAILTCPHSKGGLTFDGPVQREVDPFTPKWTVESWEPLTLSPSVQCYLNDDDGIPCCHGFIRQGRWENA